jgi:hypothetical protein
MHSELGVFRALAVDHLFFFVVASRIASREVSGGSRSIKILLACEWELGASPAVDSARDHTGYGLLGDAVWRCCCRYE